MSKNTQSGGSLLMKLFPSVAKIFLENASQDEVVKAEQEAAVLHQKLEATDEKEAEATLPPADQLTAMTTRATAAETKVTELEGKLTALEADRDKYKAWFDKQKASGTKLPGADAANRNQPEGVELSEASSGALGMFLKRKAQA